MPIEFHRDGPWDLPEGWVWARLGDLGRWTGGGTPSKAHTAYWTNGTIPWISPKDMKTDLVGDSIDRITQEAVANSTTKLVPANSVLMVVRSGILSHTFPVAVSDRQVALNQDMRALVPLSGLEARYLAFAIRRLQKFILHECSKDGTTVASVEPARLENVLVPIAPSSEQRRILARIDELFTEIADGEIALARARDDLDTWRRALLKTAVTGELTREWRERADPIETGAEYVERLSCSLNGNRRYRGRAHNQIEGEVLPELPQSWVLAEIGDIFDIATGATPKRGERRFYVGGLIPWVTSSVVNKTVVLDADEFITDAAIQETNAKVFPPGTILVAMYGEGKTRGKATELGIAAATNQACAALLQPEDDPQLRSYVKHWFEYNYLELRKQAAGGVQPNLNLEMIRRLRIPIPPREEMLEIVTALGGHFDSFAATTYELERLNHDVAGLKQSVLKAAFGGHLVEHDERDESAGGLLARLNQLNQRTEAKIKRSQFQRASRSTEIAVE